MSEPRSDRSVWLRLLCPFTRRRDAIRHLLIVGGVFILTLVAIGIHYAMGTPGEPWIGQLAAVIALVLIALRGVGIWWVDRAGKWA